MRAEGYRRFNDISPDQDIPYIVMDREFSLMSDDAVNKLIQIAHEWADYYGMPVELIIIDTPPLMHVSDAALLAQDADGILLVASWDRTTRSGLVETLDRVEPAGCPVLGIALTKVPRGKENRYLYGGYARIPMSTGAPLRPLKVAAAQATPAQWQ